MAIESFEDVPFDEHKAKVEGYLAQLILRAKNDATHTADMIGMLSHLLSWTIVTASKGNNGIANHLLEVAIASLTENTVTHQNVTNSFFPPTG
jgi:hypothetical protein